MYWYSTNNITTNNSSQVKDAHRIEVTTKITGTTIHSSEESPDMYASIDNVADRLARKLIKYKERRLAGYHGGKNMGDDMADAFPEFEETDVEATTATTEDEDPFAPEVTKIRSFDLSKPISLDEAIFALDYVDHDFYVFKDEESGDVNVVYKRNAGGIGLIQPEQ
jgi:putative sigma-54 modulation protein